MQEQAERLRQSELKLKEAEFISKEKAIWSLTGTYVTVYS